MKRLIAISLVVLLTGIFATNTFAQKAATTKYKVMVQMSSYVGEGAYVVVSLIDSKGAYEKTLYVMGPDKEWYNTVKEWHKFQSKKGTDISGITGASVTGGDRGICVIEIETAKINKGYKLRFETAVEDKEYYEKDAEIPVTTEGLAGKANGTGYIKYVRVSAN